MIFAFAAMLFMGYRVSKQDSFSEIYFIEHESLPRKLRLDEAYNISFVLTNNELAEAVYIYEIQSNITSYSKNITIYPGEKSHISLSITANEKNWVLNFAEEKDLEDKILVRDGLMIFQDQESKMILNDDSLVKSPISHYLEGFGYIYHTNLSVEELTEKPFNKLFTKEQADERNHVFEQKNVSLFVKNGELYVRMKTHKIIESTEKEKFTIKLYKHSTEAAQEHEIYFWYEIVS